MQLKSEAKKTQAPILPSPEMNGCVIADEYKFLKVVNTFLLFDSEHDVDRTVVFGTGLGLDDLGKYKNWPRDGTFQ